VIKACQSPFRAAPYIKSHHIWPVLDPRVLVHHILKLRCNTSQLCLFTLGLATFVATKGCFVGGRRETVLCISHSLITDWCEHCTTFDSGFYKIPQQVDKFPPLITGKVVMRLSQFCDVCRRQW